MHGRRGLPLLAALLSCLMLAACGSQTQRPSTAAPVTTTPAASTTLASTPTAVTTPTAPESATTTVTPPSTATSTANPPSTATSTATPASTTTPTARPPSTTTPEVDAPTAGVEVIASTLASQLQQLGHAPGPIDGTFTAATQSALSAFQAARQISPAERGALGPATAAALPAQSGGGNAVTAALQSALTDVGLFHATITGRWDAATTTAVTALQRQAGLTADGLYGPRTSQALIALDRSRVPEPVKDAGPVSAQKEPGARLLKQGSTGSAVKRLQQRLGQLGYRPGPADGSFGPATASAVLAFQKRNGLSRDGVAGPSVETKLKAPTGAGPKPGPTPRIDVDIARQIIFVVARNGDVTTLNTSTGNGETYAVPGGGSDIADTPVGSFTVLRKIPGDHQAPLGTLRNPLFFYRGWAIHGAASVPAYPASHGCARISNADADWLYPQIDLGSPVIVYDTTGESPTVDQLPGAASAGY